MSEEDLDLLVTLDDPGEEVEGNADDYLQLEDSVIGNGPYPVVFSEGDWTCTVSRLSLTPNDPTGLLNGNMSGPAGQTFDIDVCRVTCSRDGKIVEQKVFYGLGQIQKQIGIA